VTLPSLLACLKAHYGNDVTVVRRASVSGGSICAASKLRLSNGEDVFAKTARSPRAAQMFAAERDGLLALQVPGGPLVPTPIGIAEEEGAPVLLMAYIPHGRSTTAWAEDFGRALATLHRTSRHPAPGYAIDNFIGKTVQRNTWSDTWESFFAAHRLGFLVELAARQRLLSRSDEQVLERVVARVAQWLLSPEGEMSLVHGDLWTGNAFPGPGGEPVFVDPAVYFGHREVDIAMSELFGRFPEAFYRSYESVWPLQPGYAERRDGYNLYHLLNHLILFGGGYHAGVMATARKYA